MRKIDFATYRDKVRGCFAGKAIAGTMGAPYEGVKMSLALDYDPEMIRTMLPNDDLDLQVLWLDVLEQKGPSFSSLDLLERFVTHCDYSPGEYAVMRKNFEYGVWPPYSGRFNNDFFREGMGCPIRSEIWACIAPGDPALAAQFASRDGVLDHAGESVSAERFFSALESEAFFESDPAALIRKALRVVPKTGRFRRLVTDTVALCEQYRDPAAVRAFLLDAYGHPDCTNLFQNAGITLAALLLGGSDLTETAMTALRCGFDTDCTCATAGAIVGLILGERELVRTLGVRDLRYVLSVRSERRSDLVSDLADDIADMGSFVTAQMSRRAAVVGAPERTYRFDPPAPVALSVRYLGEPRINPAEPCHCEITVARAGGVHGTLRLTGPACFDFPSEARLDGDGDAAVLPLCVTMRDVAAYEKKNLFTASFCADDGVTADVRFGICADDVWRVDGPFWRTEPPVSPTALRGGESYFSLLPPSADEGRAADVLRDFHLNFAVDTDAAYADPERLFEPFRPGFDGRALTRYFYRRADTFSLSDISGFAGPCVFYLSQIVLSECEREAFLQIGRTSPVAVWYNGAWIARRDDCTTFTKENVHLKVRLKAGENRLVLRLTKVNADATFSVIFSEGATCARHLTELGCKKI